MMKRFLVQAICPLVITCFAVQLCNAQNKTIDQRVDSVLKLMTLEEKVGQKIGRAHV